MLSDFHVSQVAVFQVDLNRASRPFANQKIIVLPQASQAFLYRLPALLKEILVVLSRRSTANGAPLQNHLRGHIALGL